MSVSIDGGAFGAEPTLGGGAGFGGFGALGGFAAAAHQQGPSSSERTGKKQ